MKHMKYMNSMICVFALLMAVALDITPRAYELLLKSSGESREAWITDTIYRGAIKSYIVVEGGTPEAPANIENYTAVEVGELKIYVPNGENRRLKIVDFQKEHSLPGVGILLPPII